MSLIGRLPIKLPKSISVKFNSKNIIVKVPEGILKHKIPSVIDVEIFDSTLIIKPNNKSQTAKAFHGLFCTLINNMVIGVSEKFTKQLELKGIMTNLQAKQLGIGGEILCYIW
jgi:large subunit ribosomal protein L6